MKMKTVMKTKACLLAAVAMTLSQAVGAAAESLEQAIHQLAPKQLSAVLLQQEGRLKHELYFNGATRNDLHNIRSASKSLTSMLFGIAIQEGHFSSVDERVLPVFPEYQPLLFPSPRKAQMRFFDLLSMTNPLECDDMNNYSRGHEERMYLTYDWIQFFLNLPARGHEPWVKPPEQQPFGRDFSYCTAGISITAAAIERKVGMGMDDYAKAKLFEPMDITAYEWPYSPAGITQGGGGLSIRPRDLIKLGQLMLNQGEWNGQQLIDRSWVEKSFTAYSQAMPELKANYGLAWWIFPYEIGERTITTYAAAGNGGNYLYVVPALNATAVITATAYSTPYMHQQSQQIFSELLLPRLLQL